MLTFFLKKIIVYLYHKSLKIYAIEFNKMLKDCLMVLNFIISKSSADFAALFTSLFLCVPIWLGIQQKLAILL